MADPSKRAGASAIGDPLRDVDGLFIDPFAPGGGLDEDPSALAEKVAFRLWSAGDVAGRAIEQARKDAGGVGRLDQILVRQGLVDEEAAARALAEELRAPFASLDAVPSAPVLGEALPQKFVAEACALPLADDGEILRLALADPLDDFTLRAIAMKTRRKLEIFIASPNAIKEAVAQIYHGAPATESRADVDHDATPPGIFGEPRDLRPEPEREPELEYEPVRSAPKRRQAVLEDEALDAAAGSSAFRSDRRAASRDDEVDEAPRRSPQRDRQEDRSVWAQDHEDWDDEDWPEDDGPEDRDAAFDAPPAFEDVRRSPRRRRRFPAKEEAAPLTAPRRSPPRRPIDVAEERAEERGEDRIGFVATPSERGLEAAAEAAAARLAEARRSRAAEEPRFGSRAADDARFESRAGDDAPSRSRAIDGARLASRARPAEPRRPAPESAVQATVRRRPEEPSETAAQAAPPRRRGVVAPAANRGRVGVKIGDIADKLVERPGSGEAMVLTDSHRAPPSDAADQVRPRFVRPKRVTLKNKVDSVVRGDAGRLSRGADDELDPLAIPPMEDDGGLLDFGATAGDGEPAKRRFVRGFVGGFMGAAEAADDGSTLSREAKRTRAQSAAARKLVATEVRAALRPEPFEDPEPEPFAEPAAAVAAEGGHRPAAQEPTISDEPVSEQINAAVYQAAAALAQRERRRERAKSAAAARREQGAAVRHQLTTRLAEPSKRLGPQSSAVVAELEALGYREGAREALEEAVTGGEGLILICGPSGAGKTSTAAALATRAAGGERKIERFDRPEPKPADTDQDPTAAPVLIGAINDAETAEAAARAAMRGALVVATLDVESVAGAPPRLISMGLPPFALASCLRAVAAQHQAPRVCTRCAGSGRAVGGGPCAQCDGSGVDGEVNIVEVMALDDAMRALILAGAPEEAFRHAMTAKGTPTLADDAAAKIAAGLTSADGAAAAAAAARI